LRSLSLWQFAQPASNLQHTLTAKSNLFRKLLVVVVHKDFAATTTIEKNQNQTISSMQSQSGALLFTSKKNGCFRKKRLFTVSLGLLDAAASLQRFL